MRKQPEGERTENAISLQGNLVYAIKWFCCIFYIVSVRRNVTCQKIKVAKKLTFKKDEEISDFQIEASRD